MKDLSTDHLRKHLGEIFDRVQYADEQYLVRRKGKPIGVIVSVEMIEQLKRAAAINVTDFISKGRGRKNKISRDELSARVAHATDLYQDVARFLKAIEERES